MVYCMKQKYKIVTLGKLTAGSSSENVITKLASVLNIARDEATRLVSTQSVLRRGVTHEEAMKYKNFLEKLGILFKIELDGTSDTSYHQTNDCPCEQCGKIFNSNILSTIEGKCYCNQCIPILFAQIKQELELLKKEKQLPHSIPNPSVLSNLTTISNTNHVTQVSPTLLEEVVYEKNLSFKAAYFSSTSCVTLTGLTMLLSLIKAILILVILLPIVLAYLKSKNYYLKITNQRIYFSTGLLTKKQDEIEFIRIKDISYCQNFIEKSINYGHISIHLLDTTQPAIYLISESPKYWKDKIQSLAKIEKHRNEKEFFSQVLIK